MSTEKANETALGSAEIQPITQPEQHDQNQSQHVQGIPWILLTISILTTTFFFGLDNTVTADIQPAVVLRFDSVNKLPWLSVAFLVGAGSTTLFWGQMYGQFNAKWLYITCIIIFEVGSAVCGAAPNMNSLIVGRAICGFGGTGMYTGVMTLLSMLTDEDARPMYFGLTGLFWGLGTVLGPIIGGAFTSSPATWRWAFYINLCAAAVCAPVYLFIIPSIEPRPNVSIGNRCGQIDVLGTTLIVGTYVSGLMAISFGGVLYPWNDRRIIALFCVSAVLLILFLIQQLWLLGITEHNCAFPLHFLKDRSLSIVFVLECCASTLTYVPVYFIPLYFQFVKRDSAIVAGVRLLPLVTFLVAAIVVNGAIVSKSGRYMLWFLGGGILGLVGSALLYTVDPDTSNAKLYGYSILIGTGAGCFVQLPFSVVQSLVPAESIPKAVGFVTFAQLGAPSIMLSLVNTVFLNEASRAIEEKIRTLSHEEVISILSGIGSGIFGQLDQSSQALVLESIVDGLNRGYIVTMVAGSLTVVLSLFLSRGKIFT